MFKRICNNDTEGKDDKDEYGNSKEVSAFHSMENIQDRIPEMAAKVSSELDRCIAFWLKHSHDENNGGFFTCLGRDGSIYDTTKYGWTQGRQVWTYAKLYNEFERFHREDIYNAAIKGAEFIRKHIKDPDTKRCAFSMTAEGKHIKIQRNIFSECFYVLGMSEMYQASKIETYKNEALEMMAKILYWTYEDSTDLGCSLLKSSGEVKTLAVPMMLLCLADQLITVNLDSDGTYSKLSERCSLEILKHIQRQGFVVLENISLEGEELPGSVGRLMNPGHAIEAGWFLLRYAVQTSNNSLKETALMSLIEQPFQTGWDKENGGLFYFLDANGLSPMQLEWNMKLWWPLCESMIAFLMAYKYTEKDHYLHTFATIFDYGITHFSDPDYGEWFGYLKQEGQVSQNFKGGMFKGCYHLPRSLMICEKLLQEVLNKKPGN
ncbi:N-acylglucosamine 2-epimerase-like isoform X1 [Octopus vulgaris]|uniref:N-acylglucosamine 2-epimerase n=1 Tax=Octopus vulgaris TaxID=6645 RepID=A0AA36AFY4_OCTVU|nr:N-acylglucosamine 2-epimerase-like isoform X1 [Octopus vulgaris]